MGGIVFESVSKKFRHRPVLFNWIGKEREGETRALENVSFSAAPGRILVLLGPNGRCGKTTTLKLISTLLLPQILAAFCWQALIPKWTPPSPPRCWFRRRQ